MRVFGLLAVTATVLGGCSAEDDGGEGSSFGGSYTTAMDSGDDMTGTGESGAEMGGEETTGDGGETTGTSTDTSTSTSTGDTDTGGFVPPSDESGGGGDGAYAPCPGGMCLNGESCLSGEGPNEGKSYCAEICSPAGNPANCPDPPDGDAMPICIDVNDGMGGGNTSYCALDCSGGETCPTGLSCVDETDANGAIKICL
jgi:hypothetical protein